MVDVGGQGRRMVCRRLGLWFLFLLPFDVVKVLKGCRWRAENKERTQAEERRVPSIEPAGWAYTLVGIGWASAPMRRERRRLSHECASLEGEGWMTAVERLMVVR